MKTRREPRGEPRELPSIDVVIVNSRGLDHPWMKQALASVHAQSFPCGLLVVDNNDRALKIGAAYNQAVQVSNADLIMFLGDDDWMEPDLVASMEVCLDMARKQNAGVVIHLTTFCTAVVEHLGKMGQVQMPHMGLFRRDFLLEHPFNEELDKNVGGEMFRRLGDTAKFMGKPVTAAVVHHYGYMYRQHIGQASGMKVSA